MNASVYANDNYPIHLRFCIICYLPYLAHDIQKLAKEIRMCKVLASAGHQLELRNDMKEETFDVFIDGMRADLKSLKRHNNIEHRASKAINRQGAEIVLFEFTQENKQIHQTLAQLGKKGYKGFYYFLGKNIVHSL